MFEYIQPEVAIPAIIVAWGALGIQWRRKVVMDRRKARLAQQEKIQ